MAYQALYRKWRPTIFEDVVGQTHIVETLRNQINTNKIAHAYLFCGSRGTGKTSTAKIFSRAVNCEKPQNGNPCNECPTCLGILNNSVFDVVEIDGASNNKVDDIRNLREEIVYPPADVKYKVYIIDEVHMLTTEAFNALLKTLEEPPEYVIFILATTEFHKIPATIISRCQKFDFKRITYKDTAKRILSVAESDHIEVTPSAVNLIAKAADGSLRDGLSKLDQCIALGIQKIDYKDVALIIGASDPEFLSDFCDRIIDENLGQALKLLDDGINNGIDALRLFSDVIDYFRDLMMLKTSNDISLVINTEEEVVKRYENQISKLSLSRILKIIEVLFEGVNNAKYTSSPKLAFETALLKIASKKTNTDVDRLLERIDALEEMILKGQSVLITNVAEPPILEEPISFVEEDQEKMIDVAQDDVDEFAKIEESEEIIEPEERAEQEEISEQEEFHGEEEFFQEPEETEEEILIQFENESANEEENVPDFEEAVNDPSFEENKDFYEIPFAFEEMDQETQEVIQKEPEDTKELEEKNKAVEEVILNFKEVLKKVQSTDMGFENIIKKAELQCEKGNLVLLFSAKVMYEIAKNNKYDLMLKNAILQYMNQNIQVKLKFTKEEMEEKLKKDPFDDILEIAEQNQIIFNIE